MDFSVSAFNTLAVVASSLSRAETCLPKVYEIKVERHDMTPLYECNIRSTVASRPLSPPIVSTRNTVQARLLICTRASFPLSPTHSEQAAEMNNRLLAITASQVTHHLFDSHHSGPIAGEPMCPVLFLFLELFSS